MHRPLFVCLLAGAMAPVGAEEFSAAEAEKTLEAREAEERRRDDADNPVPLDHIQVTATRVPTTAFDVSTAVTIVDREEIAERTPQTIADYLRGQPGTFVQSTTPGQAIPIVRGLKGSEVLHIVDGFRLNTAIFRNSPNQYFALVDAQDVESIEVVRGPSSTLYGSDAMGGVVQVLTPEERFEGQNWGGRGHFRTQLASGDLSTVGRLDGAAGREDFSISGGVTYQDVGERRIGGGPRQAFTDFRAWAGQGKMLWATSPDNEITFNVQYLKQPKTPRYDELVTSFHQDSPNSDEFYFEPNDRFFAQVRDRWQANNAMFDTAEFQIGYQEINDDRRSRGAGSSNRDLETNQDQLSGATGVFSKQAGINQFVYGIEAYWDKVNATRTRINLETGAVTARAPRFPDGSTMDSFAVYLNDTIQLGERWQADVGARYSWFDIELPAGDTGIGTKLSPNDLTGNAGLTFKATDSVHLVSNIGRGFRAPNIFDLGVFGERPGGRFSIPNSELKPETVVSWDFGIKVDEGNVQAEAFVWQSRYKDKITSVEIGEDDDGLILVQNRNVTELDLWGVEMGMRWRVAETVSLNAVLNYTRGEETYAGDEYDADRIPPLNGRLGVSWGFAPDWDLDAWTLYAARQDRLSPRDLEDPRVNPAGTAGWNTWNVRVGWQFASDATLALSLENLDDRRYREHGSGTDEVGHTAIVTLDWRF